MYFTQIYQFYIGGYQIGDTGQINSRDDEVHEQDKNKVAYMLSLECW